MKGLLFVSLAILSPMMCAAQASDESQSRPPVSKSDVTIVQKARQILDSPAKWNRADDRNCPATETKFSLYCALEEATYQVTQDFGHRDAAMQEARFVIDEDLAPKNHYDHRLMDYNNDPHTTFSDVQRFFDLLQGRIEGRLAAQNQMTLLITPTTTTVPQDDIDIIKQVRAILDSPVKWNRQSTPDCKRETTTLGLYCAFQAASLRVTGKSDYEGPAIDEARLLILRTAPNAAHYNARLIDYNNDPTVSFEDLQGLLKMVEANLDKNAPR